MTTFSVTTISVLNDNYIFLLHNHRSQTTVVVDPASATEVLAELKIKDQKLSQIWNTHHHFDHVGGNQALKKQTGAIIHGSQKDFQQQRIPGIDITLNDGDRFLFGDSPVCIIATPGHTNGHICYYLPEPGWLFAGDTLFAMGCGRLFEGTPEQMWGSLQIIRSLPENTKVFCAHEYTLHNAAFALSIEPDNLALIERLVYADNLRSQGQPTIPFTLAAEKQTNPFLRVDCQELVDATGLSQLTSTEIFTHLRNKRDDF